MKKAAIITLQCTWGILQTLAGFAVLIFWACRGKIYRPPEWVGHGFQTVAGDNWGGVSLGLFSFRDKASENDINAVRHEDGHSVQSLILGLLYLPFVGIPSLINYHSKLSNSEYYKRYPENWADNLGGVSR